MISPKSTILAALLASTAMAAEYEVPGDFNTIQEAVNGAVDGDVIRVGPGTWPGRLDFRGKQITIESMDGPSTTTLNANGVGSVVLFQSSETTNSILDGFTITGGTGSLLEGEITGGGIHVVESSPTIQNCIITGNTAYFGGGVAIWEGAPIIRGCTFTNNHADGDGGGLRLHHYSQLSMENCTFTNNSANVFGGGINYGHYSQGLHANCFFDSNVAGLRGGAIASACDCNDPALSNSDFCNSQPDHILGGWEDEGSNEFCPVCTMDVNADSVVDVNDVLQVIEAWGGCVCVEDIDGDTVVGVNDLLLILSEYGECPA
tara:strand:- start:2201 stop:3154 length:954 start_codon:yes stop_codon:yes gene_type:complete